jgi:hypothetical protein
MIPAKQKLFTAVTTTGLQEKFQPRGSKKVFQAYGTTSAGAGSATIVIQGSIFGDNFITLGTISLTLGTTLTSDGFAIDACWPFVRANVSAISGTNATVTGDMGIIEES